MFIRVPVDPTELMYVKDEKGGDVATCFPAKRGCNGQASISPTHLFVAAPLVCSTHSLAEEELKIAPTQVDQEESEISSASQEEPEARTISAGFAF